MTSERDPKQQMSIHDPGPFARLFLRVYANLDAVRFMAEPSSNARVAGWVLTQWVVVVSALVVDLVGTLFDRPFSFLGFCGLALAMYVLAELDIRGHEDEQFHDRLLMARYGTRRERITTAMVLGFPLPAFVLLLAFR